LDSVERKWSVPVDGLLYAAPLLAAGRVFAATESDTVYAFDAATGGLAWQRHLADPMRGSQLPCGNIDPTGITGTPVIDPAGSTLYVVAFAQPGPPPALRA